MGVGDDIGAAVTLGALAGACKEAWKMAPVSTVPGQAPYRPAMPQMVRGVVGGATQLGMAGAMYSIGTAGMAGLRNKDDALNSGVGGAAVGIYAGLIGKGGLHGAIHKGIGFAGMGILCSFVASKVIEKSATNAAHNATLR
mgnify:CR=1 FL=1|jgi:hypothetical protein